MLAPILPIPIIPSCMLISLPGAAVSSALRRCRPPSSAHARTLRPRAPTSMISGMSWPDRAMYSLPCSTSYERLSGNLIRMSRRITAKISAVLTPNMRSPSVASIGPSIFQAGDIGRSP